MLTFSRLLTRHSKTCGMLPVLRLNNYSSSSVTPELKPVNSSQMEKESGLLQNGLSKSVLYPKSESPMVAAAFASLNSQTTDDIKTPIFDDKIKKATTVEEVLTLSEGSGISRKHALRVVSILANWCMEGKIQLAEFETDPRFINLCRVLTRGLSYQSTKSLKYSASRSEDLTTILSVTADDEAAKLVSSITLAQMVKVMSTLSMKKRRSTLLLRTLSFNIAKSAEQLNLKQCGDLLYSMSTLNFSDENLLSRIANDVCTNLNKNFKISSVVGSIITSVGLLKYKNPDLLDSLCEWVMANHLECRPQDIYSLFMTLAIVNYIPSNSEELFGALIPLLNPLEAGKPLVWLEIVWSLVLLNKATTELVAGVLNNAFLKNFEGNSSVSTRLKLLNIDGAAQYLLHKYKGPRIPDRSVIRDARINQNKHKVEMVDAIIDSMKSLIQTDKYLRTRVDTGFGFSIDSECAFDKKFNPVIVNSARENSGAIRIAILAQEYHDMCLGKIDPTGINVLSSSILQAQGYKVLIVPYTDFRPRDKLVLRVQYLESKLKGMIREP